MVKGLNILINCIFISVNNASKSFDGIFSSTNGLEENILCRSKGIGMSFYNHFDVL